MDLVPKEYKQKKAGILGAVAGKPAFSLGKFSLPKLTNLSAMGGNFLRAGIILGAAILFLLLLGWAGLKFYQSSLVSQIQNLQEQQSQVFPIKDRELVADITDFESGAKLIQDLFKNHVYTSEILDKLAASTLPQVQWESYGLDVKSRKITLKGRAANYSVLAKQILALQESGFSQVSVSSIALDKVGGVSFGMNFEFDPKIIQK